MKQVWTVDELGEFWTLSSDEFALIEKRRQPENRLGFVHQIKHYQFYARFLDSDRGIPAEITEYLIDQIGDSTAQLDAYDWVGRSGRRYCPANVKRQSDAAWKQSLQGTSKNNPYSDPCESDA